MSFLASIGAVHLIAMRSGKGGGPKLDHPKPFLGKKGNRGAFIQSCGPKHLEILARNDCA